jgi:hypothetical protein
MLVSLSEFDLLRMYIPPTAGFGPAFVGIESGSLHGSPFLALASSIKVT